MAAVFFFFCSAFLELAIFEWLINYETVLNEGNAEHNERSVLTIQFYGFD